MTPTHRFLARMLPGPLVLPELALIYALLIGTVLLRLGNAPPDVLYIDAPRTE